MRSGCWKALSPSGATDSLPWYGNLNCHQDRDTLVDVKASGRIFSAANLVRLKRPPQQQAVLRRDFFRYFHGLDGIPGIQQSRGPGGIHRQGAVHPGGQAPGITGLQIMAAGQNRHPVAGADGQVENLVGQGSAGVDRGQKGIVAVIRAKSTRVEKGLVI